MEVHVESTGALTRSLHVKLDPDAFDREFESRLKTIAGRAKVPGFRPGKAPLKVIRQQYGAGAQADAVSELLRQTYPDAVTQADVKPASMPRFELESEPPNEPLAYVAYFDVLPEVKLDKLDQLTITRPEVEVTDGDVDQLIENLRKARREWVPVERAAQVGDQVAVDFEGKLDGEGFEDGKGENVEIELGAGRFLEALESAIVGHGANDRFTSDVTFPDDYRNEALRGKDAQFDVTVHTVKEPKLPEIDSEFLKTHGVEESAGVDGLRAKCRKALETERDKSIRSRVKQAVMEQLLATHPLEVPPSRVEAEVERLREEAAERMGLNRMGTHLKPEKRAQMLPAELFEERAKQRVALGLLVGQFIDDRKIKVDEARVDALLDGVAGDYENPEELRQYYRGNEELMSGLHAAAIEDQAVDELLAQARVTAQTMSLDELMNPRPPATP